MKKIFILICWLSPVLTYSQVQQKKSFTSFQNWQAVLDSAKTSNKNIFLYAFATWCGPCKEMDAKIYPDFYVKNYIESNFIAVKVQMDQTKNDITEIKKWYTDASILKNKYSIDSYPTFLFLDPDGNLIQINKGYQDARQFLAILKQANDPRESYTEKVTLYKHNKLASKDLLNLAVLAKNYKQDALAMEIALAYKKRYLDNQEVSEVMKPQTADVMIVNFYPLLSFRDSLVKYLYNFPKQVDSIFNRKGISNQWADFFIVRDIVEPEVKPRLEGLVLGHPQWAKLRSQIAKKFDGRTAKRVILNQQIFYYHKKADYENAIKYELEKIETYGLDTAGLGKSIINGLMFNVVFQHTNNPKYLKKAINYMLTIIATNPNREAWIDTYANLLYKVGKKEKAIKEQERALEIAKSNNNEGNIKLFTENLRKMEAGYPTWDIDCQQLR